MAPQKAALPSLFDEAPRAFKQQRALKTYEALLDAAQAVFARRGFEGAQTPEIAAEAGVSTGAFYRYFTDKRQCFIEMMRRNLVGAYAEVTEKLAPALFQRGDVRRAIDAAIDVLFAHIRRDAELARVYLGMSLRDPDVEALRTEYERRGLDALTELVRAVVPPEAAPDPRAAALVVQLAVMEVASERAALRPALDPRVPDGEVKAALREMLYRFLFSPSVSSASRRSGRGGRKASGVATRSRRGG